MAVVVGTRPEAIKLAPVIAALSGHPRLQPVVVVSGQHSSMVAQVFDIFGIRPDVDLHVDDVGSQLHSMVAAVISRLGDYLARHRPDAVLVQGDTTTALGAALVGFYAALPVVHLEAGLRSDDRRAPFPEEVHRRALTLMADCHLAPTATAAVRLGREGVNEVYVTGNTVVDALLAMRERRTSYRDQRLESVDAHHGRVVLVTAHRRESWGAPLDRIALAVAHLAGSARDVTFVVSAHPNPIVRASFSVLAELPRVLVVAPEPYDSFVRLLARADLVVTDSGGIQEEAATLGTRALVTRTTTERVEGIHAGIAQLVGTEVDAIVNAVEEALAPGARTAADVTAIYGDGLAATRAVDHIDRLLRSARRTSMPQTSSAAGVSAPRCVEAAASSVMA
ncbi:MAG: UDP-N-acetylglucosamine 2-epimerase (non-hydrolyzing) [Micrococcales bacterium]|nr:UDP-N-acetylglucosamine 2-epimerase (non-hydrolyzing) [Micrococcales bacterium]